MLLILCLKLFFFDYVQVHGRVFQWEISLSKATHCFLTWNSSVILLGQWNPPTRKWALLTEASFESVICQTDILSAPGGWRCRTSASAWYRNWSRSQILEAQDGVLQALPRLDVLDGDVDGADQLIGNWEIRGQSHRKLSIGLVTERERQHQRFHTFCSAFAREVSSSSTFCNSCGNCATTSASSSLPNTNSHIALL